MLTVFEVIVVPGHDPGDLLTPETLRETQAQVLTIEEARALGFPAVLPDPKGREVRLIAVAPRDASFLQRRLEGSAGVHGFRVHEHEM